MPISYSLAMPAIIARNPQSASNLLDAATSAAKFTTDDIYEAVWLDSLLAQAMLDVHLSPESARDIYLRATAPGRKAYSGKLRRRFERTFRTTDHPSSGDICEFVKNIFAEQCDDAFACFDEQALKEDFADLGVTTGYIGNCKGWGDDRCFMVFTRVRFNNGTQLQSISVMETPNEYRRFAPGQPRKYFGYS